MSNNNRKENRNNNRNANRNSSPFLTIAIDLSNRKLKQTTFCDQPNPLYHFGPHDNKIIFQLRKTEHFDAPIDDSLPNQPVRLIMPSMRNTNQYHKVIPNTIIGYIVKDTKSNINILHEINYKKNFGSRSVTTTSAYNAKADAELSIPRGDPFLIVYIDEHIKIQIVGNMYLNTLLSAGIDLKIGAYFSNQANYFKQHYKVYPSYHVFLNPQEKEMEPNVTTPFTRMKATLITIKNAKGSAYCIRNVHPPNTVEEMRNYVNSSAFEALYIMKSGSTGVSQLLNEMKAGDFIQEYDRMIFFFMKQMDLLINFKNWIRTLANAIGVDAYIALTPSAGLNVQINVMKNNTIKNMNIGIHTDYRTDDKFLYPDGAETIPRKTARTILTYVDLYGNDGEGKPVIGFTTKIAGMSQENAQKKLSDYSLKEKYASYVRLSELINRLEEITDKVDEAIQSILTTHVKNPSMFPIFIPSNYDSKRSMGECFTLIDSILIPDIDDPYYYFKSQRDTLKKINDDLKRDGKEGFDYRLVLNEIHEVLKTAVNKNSDISNWNYKFLKDDRFALLSKYTLESNKYQEKFTGLCKKDWSGKIKSEAPLIIHLCKILKQGNMSFIILSDVERFIDTYMNDPEAPADVSREEIRAYIAENFQDTTEYMEVLHGNACPFVDGGIVYFNGADTHTLDSGIGRRISIVYKVSYVDRQPDNPLSIEEREREYFDQFKDDVPLAIPTVIQNNIGLRQKNPEFTSFKNEIAKDREYFDSLNEDLLFTKPTVIRNNKGISYGTYAMRPPGPARARNFGGKRTVRRTRRNKRRHISRKNRRTGQI